MGFCFNHFDNHSDVNKNVSCSYFVNKIIPRWSGASCVDVMTEIVNEKNFN